MFARRIFQKWNTFLFHLSLRGLGILNFGNDNVTGERHLIHKILPELFENDRPVCFDVGANIGNFSKKIFSRFPNAKIFAFEPHPVSYSLLVERFTQENITCQQKAMGKEQGKTVLYNRTDDDGSSHASLYRRVISDIHGQDLVSEDVDIDTIDSYAEKNDVDQIDFLKIDTEGNEFDVLLGAQYLLNQNRIDLIYFEFNQMNVISHVFLDDFKRILSNYQLYRLLPKGLLPLNGSQITTELFAYQNILAVHEDRMSHAATKGIGIN